MRVQVQSQFAPLYRRLDQLSERLRGQVVTRALNRTGEAARTVAVREISRTYNITAAKTRERISVSKAFAAGRLAVTVEVRSRFGKRATNLITFGARQLARGGVSVKIRRDKPPLRGRAWFIVTNRKTGGTFVARRTGTAKGDIEPVRTVDVGQMFNSRATRQAILARIRAVFPAEFARQFRLATQARR